MKCTSCSCCPQAGSVAGCSYLQESTAHWNNATAVPSLVLWPSPLCSVEVPAADRTEQRAIRNWVKEATLSFITSNCSAGFNLCIALTAIMILFPVQLQSVVTGMMWLSAVSVLHPVPMALKLKFQYFLSNVRFYTYWFLLMELVWCW